MGRSFTVTSFEEVAGAAPTVDESVVKAGEEDKMFDVVNNDFPDVSECVDDAIAQTNQARAYG